MLKETLTMLLIFSHQYRNLHFLVRWYSDFFFKRRDSIRGLGNGANEFCRAGATKVSTFVMAFSTDDSELLCGWFPTPFTNTPSGCEVDRDGLAKFIF
jgi:hypothetical protein